MSRGVFVGLLVAVMGCASPAEGGKPAAKQAPPALPAEAAPAGALLAPGSPLASPEAQEALSALSSDSKRAADVLLRLAEKASGQDALRLRFAGAVALSRAGEHAKAAPIFDELSSSYPELGPYAAAFAAESYTLLKQDKEAIAAAERVKPGQPIARFALRLRAEAKDRLGLADTAQAFLDFVTESPRSPRAEKSWARLAELRLAAGDKEGAAEAFRKIVSGWPEGSGAKEAQAQLDALASSLGAMAVALRPEERERRALFYYEAQRHKDSERAFQEVVDAAPAGAVRCRARGYLARSVMRQRDFDRAASLFLKAADDCTSHDLDQRRDALYQAGKNFQKAGECEEAIKAYAKTEKEFSSSSLADDARLHRGECLREQKDATAEEVLRSVARDYPSGDMAEEATWALAWAAYRDADWDRAYKLLDEGNRSITKVTNYWSEGRLGYWLGRVSEKRSDKKAAKEAYLGVLASYPLSYYARLSYLRLAALDAKAAKAALLKKPASPAKSAVSDASRVAVSKEPAFLRGQELLLLGLVDYARDEFATLSAEDADSQWLLADRYDYARAYPWSHNIPRRKVPEFRFDPPTEARAARRWQVAYPSVFSSYIVDWSTKNGIPTPLAFAIMREESSFNPGIESHSHAIGLMQLLVPTANDQAKALGMPRVTADDLRKPETNIALGTRYLSYLLTYFDGNVCLVAAGYNAGQGAVRRWLKEFGDIPLDEFVERIPYEETRRYTQRVMTSYEVYSYLYDLDRTELAFTLPVKK